MIVIEYMENGSLDGFLRVSVTSKIQEPQHSNFPLHCLESFPKSSAQSAVVSVHCINITAEILWQTCCSAVTYISIMSEEMK